MHSSFPTDPTGTSRADSGNGISATVDFSRWVFINPDLSVYLHRLPEGEWVCLDAQTTIEPSGIGLVGRPRAV